MIELADRIHSVEEYYFSKKLQEVKSLDQKDHPIINLGIGSPDLMPDDSVIKTLTQMSQHEDIHAYQSYRGIPELRAAIAQYYRKYFGVNLDDDNEILPLMGSKEGIMHITQAFVNPGEKVLIPNPGYPTYAAVSNLAHADIEYYNLREEINWELDLTAIEKMDLNKVKIFWLNSPHMPTGVQYPKDMLQKLVVLAQKHQFLIVNDNPYSMILNDDYQSIMSIEGAEDLAIELNSLSKSHNMAGWRIGWCLAAPKFIEAILKVKSNMDSGMFKPLQLAAVKALELNDDWFDRLNTIYRKRKVLAEKILDQLECKYEKNQKGLFVWAKISNHISSESLIDQLLYEYKIFLSPGFIFGSQGEGYIRISLCANEEAFKEALKRIRHYKS